MRCELFAFLEVDKVVVERVIRADVAKEAGRGAVGFRPILAVQPGVRTPPPVFVRKVSGMRVLRQASRLKSIHSMRHLFVKSSKYWLCAKPARAPRRRRV